MGWFSKKPAAAPATKTAPPPAPIAITGMSVACHAGDQPYALITSILAQISGTQLSDEYQVLPDDSTQYVVPRMAPVEELGKLSATERMYSLATIALGNAVAQLPGNVKPESLLIVLMIDPELITHSGEIDTPHFQRHLVNEIQGLEPATFRIQPNNANSSTSALRTSIAELNEGKWQAVIFGGADSMISTDACQKLLDQNRLNIIGKKGGLIPGEAAAFVVLQGADTASNATPALGYLRGVGVAAEPHAQIADREATTGLTTAINQALAQAGMAATGIHGIVHNLGAETVQAFEWYKTTQKIWPRKISEQQRMAVQLGEIDQPDIPDDPIPRIELPYMTMGHVGAAAMPIQLATALAWLEYSAGQARYGFPLREHLLVCDTPDAPERGALIVSATLAAAT